MLNILYENTRAFSGNIKLWLIIIFLAVLSVIYFTYKKYFLEIIKDLRWLRLTHYILMLALGIVIASKHTVTSKPLLDHQLILNILLTIISMTLTAIFCIITNNLADVEIDRVSNQSRPSVTGRIPTNTYLTIGLTAAFLALVYAFFINLAALLTIAAIMVIYSLYSLPPLRLKKITILSKLAISINSLAIISLGYLLEQHTLQHYPLVLVPLFLIGFTLSINFIDIKDIAGDNQAGIKTIPVLIGHKNAALMIGVMFFCTYISFYFLVKNILILPFLIGGGILQFFFITKERYDERFVFIIYLSSVIFLIFWLGMDS